jgi:hypothetical protein
MAKAQNKGRNSYHLLEKRAKMYVTTVRIEGPWGVKHSMRVVFKKKIQDTHVVPGIVSREFYKSIWQKHAF